MSRFSRKIQRSHKPKSRAVLYIVLSLILLFLVILVTQILVTRYTGQAAPSDPAKPRDTSLQVIGISVFLGVALLAWIFLSKRQKK